jgi:hypothetical protein
MLSLSSKMNILQSFIFMCNLIFLYENKTSNKEINLVMTYKTITSLVNITNIISLNK